jgi:hypothetical protein
VVTHERGRREGGEEGGEEAEPRGVERTHVRVGAVEDGHGRRFVLCIHRHSEAPSEDVGRALAVHALALKALMQRGNLGLGGLRLRLEVLDQLLELCDILGGGHRDGEGDRRAEHDAHHGVSAWRSAGATARISLNSRDKMSSENAIQQTGRRCSPRC